MTDATILIPTYRHAALLPYALSSALAQSTVSIEVLVVGDGVTDDTRTALQPFLDDPRVRFLDFPKGERHGEAHRHEALAGALGRIVCYQSDDDLLLPHHTGEMLRLLEDADFAHSAPLRVRRDGMLQYLPIDVSEERFRKRLRRPGGWNAIGLTGTAHTLDAYRRLPYGWRAAPVGTPTDLHMWRQFVELPGFKGVTARRLTHLHFGSGARSSADESSRVAELELWSARMAGPAFERELLELVAAAAMAEATTADDDADRLRELLRSTQESWWWRLGGAVRRTRRLRSRPPRAR